MMFGGLRCLVKPALSIAAVSGLLAAAVLGMGCAGESKESVIREMLDCQAERDDLFEESMMMMFPAAGNLEQAIDQYVYVSQAADLEDLKAARDEMCGAGG